MPKPIHITPNCCDAVQKERTVFLVYPIKAVYEIHENGQENYKPEWCSRSWSTKLGTGATKVLFCPHCGKRLPEIKRRKTDKPICVVIDGGYYCSTCRERLTECECYPPEYAWDSVKH